jgi:MATE family multidrug resistance protein
VNSLKDPERPEDGDALPAARHPFALRPHHTLVGMSIPVMLSLVAEPLTGLVDTAFVARLGSAPLAALGVGTVLLSSTLWIFNFLGVGTQTEVAHALGARDRERASEVSGVALALSLAVGGVLGVVLWPLLGPIARAMGASGAVEQGAVRYLEIRLLGAPAVIATLATFGSLRGVHDMRTPLYVAAGSNALNALLDAILITGAGPIPAFGIAGAAWATTLSHWVGVTFAVAAVRRRIGLPQKLSFRLAGALLVVGRDLFFRTTLLVAFIVLGTRAATRIGSDAGAAHQGIRQVWLLTALALDAFAASAQSLVGYFLGAGETALARRVAGVALAWSFGSGVALLLAMLALEGAAAAALAPPSARELFAAAWWIAALAQPLNAVSFATDGIHWGTRDYRYLRNAMAFASIVGAALLLGADALSRASLPGIWLFTAVWITLRAALGTLRVWPGIGRAPLAAISR